MSVTSFFAVVRSWGFERRSDAPIAGVASGLADTWRVDPILVRAGFLALTFVGGAGPMLYALCWAVLPDAQTKEIHAEEAVNGRFPIGLVGAMSLFLISLAMFTSMSFFGALGLLVTSIVAFLVYASMSGKDTYYQPPTAPAGTESTQSWTEPTTASFTASSYTSSYTPGTESTGADYSSYTDPSAPYSFNNFGSDPMNAQTDPTGHRPDSSHQPGPLPVPPAPGQGHSSAGTSPGTPPPPGTPLGYTPYPSRPASSTFSHAPADPAAARRKAERKAHADVEAQRAKAARERARTQRAEERNRRNLSGRVLAGILGFVMLALAAFIIVIDSGHPLFDGVSPVAASIGFFAALLGLTVMVVGVFGRRGGFLSVLAVVVAFVAVPPVITNTTVYSNSMFAGGRMWAPRTSDQIGSGFSVHMGDAVVDFSGFVPDNPPEHINVVSSMSSLNMLFRADQKVAIISRVTMGSLESNSPDVRLANGAPLDQIDVGGISRDTIFIGGITSISDADIVIEADISMSGANIDIVR